ncbi:MAG: glycosyltransferase [Casimicrobiaceae bacterium]
MFLSHWKKRSVDPEFSVVVCSIDEKKFDRIAKNYATVFSRTTMELIGIHDARSLSEAYNRAIRRARGQYIIFSHDDIRVITPDFSSRLQRHFQRFDLFGVAGTTRVVGGAWFLAGDPYDYQLVTSPHPDPGKYVIVGRGRGPLVIGEVQALDGLFMATRAPLARSIRFDANTFDGFHLYDLDFSYRAFLAGYRLGVCRDLFIIHESHGTFDNVWASFTARFEAKFRDQFAVVGNKKDSPLTNVLLDADVLENPSAVEELCSSEALSRLIPT